MPDLSGSQPGPLGVSVFQWVPGLEVVSSYRRRWLVKDVIAGVVLTTLLVPQGMGLREKQTVSDYPA